MQAKDLITSTIILSIFMLSHPAQADDPNELIIRELATSFIGMVRTNNPTPLSKIAQIIDDDFTQIHSSGKIYRGKKVNLDFNREAITEIHALFHHFEGQYIIQFVRVNPQTALIFGKVVLAGSLKEGDLRFQREILETLYFEKKKDGWKIVHEHSTRIGETES